MDKIQYTITVLSVELCVLCVFSIPIIHLFTEVSLSQEINIMSLIGSIIVLIVIHAAISSAISFKLVIFTLCLVYINIYANSIILLTSILSFGLQSYLLLVFFSICLFIFLFIILLINISMILSIMPMRKISLLDV
jgi:hypothetical protein